MKFIAFTVKGLEEFAQKEISYELKEKAIISRVFDKAVLFEFGGEIGELVKLKIPDNIGIFLGEFDEQGFINENLLRKQLGRVLKSIAKIRPINSNFSVTYSIVSKKLNKETFEELLINSISRYGLKYTPQDRSNLDFRVFISGQIRLLAVRLTKEPLYKREYCEGNYLGSLKPTIAAAMIFDIKQKFRKNAKLVDSFCGSGTILCEALGEGFEVYGGDINPKAVQITKQRLKTLGYKDAGGVMVVDAIKTNWGSQYFDCAVSNLPWDKQHEVEKVTTLYSNTVKEYKRILKPQFKLCIICHKPEILIKYIKKEFGTELINRYDIRYLGQSPTIVIAENL